MSHSRNRHQGRYDFHELIKVSPELSTFVAPNRYGDESIDFANPLAVKALNRALLKKYYGILNWDIPENALCPPIPGRADYIHLIADLLAEQNGNEIPKGPKIRGLDIGVGANCIYPIIGHGEYAWRFVGADINPSSLQNAAKIVTENAVLAGAVQFRLQKSEKNIFVGIIEPDDDFDFTLCNPPFHASLEEAQAGSARKWRNLAKTSSRHDLKKQVTNFGGQGAELWCEGGELRFIKTMIEDSILFQNQCRWFSTLVSKDETLPKLYAALKVAKAKTVRTLDMAQGQKKSRVLAWSF